jgi:hypothetical protein
MDAMYLLTRAGPSAVPALIKALKSEDPETRAGAAQALQMMHIYRADMEEACIQALKDPSARVRQSARFLLAFQVTEQAKDALLEDELAELKRNREDEQRALVMRTRAHTEAEVLSPIPPDPDHKFALKVTQRFETKAPDGTTLLTVLHKGEQRDDLLRVWNLRASGYYLLKEKIPGETGHLSTGSFRYGGNVYLHVRTLWGGNGGYHDDELFRVESGLLTELRVPKSLPVKLSADESTYGLLQWFEDDNLRFQFDIWKAGDPHCCPSAGQVKGTYVIVGDELKYADWSRSNASTR